MQLSKIQPIAVLVTTLVAPCLANSVRSDKLPTQAHAGKIELKTQRNSHKWKFILKWAKFNPHKHSIKFFNPKKGLKHDYIDGRIAVGTEGKAPLLFITDISAWKDENRVAIPRSLWRDLYDPLTDIRDYRITTSRDGKSLIVSVMGGNGENRYLVEWHVNQKSSRVLKFD